MVDEIKLPIVSVTITDVDTKLKQHTTMLDELKLTLDKLQKAVDKLEEISFDIKQRTDKMPTEFTRSGQYRIR